MSVLLIRKKKWIVFFFCATNLSGYLVGVFIRNVQKKKKRFSISFFLSKEKSAQKHRSCMLLLLFLTFSALVANPKKTTLHGGQSRLWSAEQGKKEKEKVWHLPPPPRALLVRRKKKKKKKKIRKSRGASTCLGATQAGVTQVVSVRLASVQGFLRLVS